MGKLSFAIALNLLTDGVKKGAAEAQNIVKNLTSKITSTLGSLGLSFGAFSFGREALEAGGKFEDAMARVRAVSNATKSEFKAMEDEAQRLGATTKYSATDAANALENLVRNGLKPLDAAKAVGKTLEFAQANTIELAEAADIATNVMNGFGKEVSDLGNINDVLSSTAAHSATNVTDLAEALKIAAPMATTAKIGIEETNAALGTLANVGFKGTDAGTGVKQMLIAISSQSSEAAKTLKRYGVNLNETTLKNDGLVKSLQKLKDSGIGNSIGDLVAVFGKLAAPKAAALINNVDKLSELSTTLKNSQGENARMFEQSTGKYMNALHTLKSTWESVMISIFKKSEGGVVGFLNAVIGGLNYIKDNLTKIAVQIAAAFATSKLVGVWRGWKAAAATAAASSVTSVQTATAKIAILEQQALELKRGIALRERALETATAQERVRLEEQTMAKRRALAQNFAAQRKLNAVKIAATEQASATASATAWGSAWRGMKATAVSAAASMKAAFMSFIPMAAISLVIELGSALKDLWDKAHAAEERLKDVADKSKQLDDAMRTNLGIMKRSEKGSAAWQAALKNLKDEYPDLISKLDLEKVSVKTNAKEYNELKKKIDGAISSQKEYWATEAKLANVKGKKDDFFGRNEGFWGKHVDAFGSKFTQFKSAVKGQGEGQGVWTGSSKQQGEFDSAMADVESLLSDSSLSTEGKFKRVYHKIKNFVGSNRHALQMAKNIAKAYDESVGTYEKSVLKTLPKTAQGGATATEEGETNQPPHSGEDKKKKKDSELEKLQKDYATKLENLNFEYKEGLLTEKKFNEKKRELLKDLARSVIDSDEKATKQSTFGRKALSDYKKDFGESANRKAKELEDEYKKRLQTLKANESTFTKDDFESEKEAIYKEFKNSADEAVKEFTELGFSSSKLVEAFGDFYAVLGKAESDLSKGKAEDYTRNKAQDYKKTKREISEEELNLAQQKLSDMMGGRFKEAGKTAAQMIEDINAQILKVKSLKEALQLDEIREDLKNFQEQVNKLSYEGLRGGGDALIGVANAWQQLSQTMSNADATAWEKIQAVWSALTSSIDGVLQIVNIINEFTKASEMLAAAKQAEGLATQTASAAAVEAAATQKAAQTAEVTTAIAANAALAKSAQVLMASQATAAYAAIPFAGIGLAAKQIAGMKALIAGASAFARGGIVGGNDYHDNTIARVSSGEMILNSRQQRNLFNSINRNELGGGGVQRVEIVGRLRGSDIYFSQRNDSNRHGRRG